MIFAKIRQSIVWILILLLFAANARLIQRSPVFAEGETLTIGAPVVFSSSYTISSAQFIDNANSAYFLDPAATGNSLVLAGAASKPDGGTWTASSCSTGYILVPGSATLGTNDFCIMKYEAKQDANKNPISEPTGSPWVSVDWYESREACKRVGAHLITSNEWTTIARNIEATTINDLDDDAALQLATSHSDNAPASSLATTAGADPVVTGCTLTSTMENASNVYSAASCEIRGTGAGGSTDNDKGYYGTGQQWSATGYSAGVANKSQLRTAVLSNGKVIWDFAGDVWEWNDWQCGTGVWYSVAGWIDWTNANLTDYEKYAAGPSGSLTSANGAGQYYACSANGNAAVRSGFWSYGAVGGPFTLYLDNAPSHVYSSVGFRCAK